MPDYEILRLIWWALLGILLIGFAVTDGYDLGTLMLLPFVARDDDERRQALATVEPTWEGHQVWFVLGGGASFAAWPLLYATSFSGFYVAMLLVLAALILRAVGFNFRSKLPDPVWRAVWDWILFVGGLVPSLVFGVAFGNLLLGVPFHLEADLRSIYDGSFFGLFRPFALLAGLVSVTMLAMHGGAWIALKSDGAVAQRGSRVAAGAAVILIVLFALAGWWIANGVTGYAITGAIAAHRRMARQFPQRSALGRHTRPDVFRCGSRCRLRARPARPAGVSRERRRRRLRHRDRRRRSVSVPAAVLEQSREQPDGVGFVEQPAHVVHHAGRDDHLAADRAVLHRLGHAHAQGAGAARRARAA